MRSEGAALPVATIIPSAGPSVKSGVRGTTGAFHQLFISASSGGNGETGGLCVGFPVDKPFGRVRVNGEHSLDPAVRRSRGSSFLADATADQSLREPNGESHMAKKKSGTSIGLILVLIFFVLATFICGTVAYFGYSEQEQFKKQAKEAKDDLAKEQTKYREERVRKIVLRTSIGIETPDDRVTLVTEYGNFQGPIMDEVDTLLQELKDKTPEPFLWELLTTKSADDLKKLGEDPDAIRADKDNTLGIRPKKFAHVMAFEWKKKYETDIKANRGKLVIDKREIIIEPGQYVDELTKVFADNIKRIQATQGTDKLAFDAQIAALTVTTKNNYDKVDAEFKKLAEKHKNDGAAAAQAIDKKGKEYNELMDSFAKVNIDLGDLKKKLEKYETAERALDAKAIDLLVKEEAKGRIVSKDENDFVIIDIGSNRKLKPQVRFLVISSGISWLALEEKETSLKKYTLSNERLPYEDNPYVKAAVEVVEILGPERARAKILFENNRIRNPVQIQDQVFNVAWQPEEQIRVAFAGIIDLDGDGIDNNQEFLTQLERHGVIVDEYLKMNPLDFAKRDGRGLSLQTKYLIIADDPRFEGIQLDPNSPQRKYVEAVLGKMSDIKLRARSMGVQMVDARKFVSLMGYKLPKSPAPLQYGSSVYWGGAANVTPKEPNP